MLSAESINFTSNLIPVGGRKLNSLDLLLVAELQLLAAAVQITLPALHPLCLAETKTLAFQIGISVSVPEQIIDRIC